MKNRHTAILILVTCMFASFTLGFLSGRATAPGDTIITQISAQTRTTTPSSDTRSSTGDISILPIVTEETAAVPTTEPQATESPSTPPAVVEETSPIADTATSTVPPETQSSSTSPAVAEETVPVPDTTAATEPPATESTTLININTATVSQLDTLPGIGPVIAQRIIDYREAHGPFTAVSQLILVDGIGEKRLAAIIDLITI